KEIYDELVPYAEYHGLTTMGASTYGPLHRHLGALAQCYGEVGLAETHYQAALAASERMHSPVYLSATSYLYARMLLRAGDGRRRLQAADLLTNSLQLAQQFELHALTIASQHLARKHAISSERLVSSGG